MMQRLSLLFILFCMAVPVLADEVTLEGTAVSQFNNIGAWGWKVDVDSVLSGPSQLEGKTISVSLASVNPSIPRGLIDPDIVPGDRVEVFGNEDGDLIKLYGSADYYISRLQASSEDIETQVGSEKGPGEEGWKNAPIIYLDQVIEASFTPFEGSFVFQPEYYKFNVPHPGILIANVTQVPANGAIMIWLDSVDPHYDSTFVSSGQSQNYGGNASLRTEVQEPGIWGIMIQCDTIGELQDSAYSFEIRLE